MESKSKRVKYTFCNQIPHEERIKRLTNDLSRYYRWKTVKETDPLDYEVRWLYFREITDCIQATKEDLENIKASTLSINFCKANKDL